MTWSDEIDDVLAHDLTAALAYVTPAGGAVVTAIAPIGLRDRDAGWIGFTTSLGFGKKLDRIRRDPRVALAFHARAHGRSTSPRYVLVQGTAEIVAEPDQAWRDLIEERAEPHLGPAKRGRLFWDRWLREYYRVRVPVTVAVERIVAWPTLACDPPSQVTGAPWPADPPPVQRPPKGGTGPRVDAERAARRCARHPHQLLAYRGGDGFPVVVPVRVRAPGGEQGIRLDAGPGLLPPGGRRAGLLAHSYRPQLIGLATRYFTGWLDDGTYAPHTEAGFSAPPNKNLLLLVNGLLAKRGVAAARRAARLPK